MLTYCLYLIKRNKLTELVTLGFNNFTNNSCNTTNKTSKFQFKSIYAFICMHGPDRVKFLITYNTAVELFA